MCERNNSSCCRECKNKKMNNKNSRSRRRQQHKHRHYYHKGGGIADNVKNIKNLGSIIHKTIDDRMRKKASRSSSSGKFDIHGASLSAIKKIFGKRGMVPKPYHYLGPGNDLLNQLVIGRNGKIKKYKVKPYNVLDQIASKHDVCYQNGRKSKNACDYEMLRNMKGVGKSNIPAGMGNVVKAIIGGKLMLGV